MNEKSLFAAALERSPAEQAAFLDEACAGDASLRARLEALLKAHEEAGDFLDKPALGEPGVLTPGEKTHSYHPTITEGPGTRIGPYKLLQKIGEGGMGVVYMAEQTTSVCCGPTV